MRARQEVVMTVTGARGRRLCPAPIDRRLPASAGSALTESLGELCIAQISRCCQLLLQRHRSDPVLDDRIEKLGSMLRLWVFIP